MRTRSVAAAALIGMLALAGCTAKDATATPPPTPSATPTPSVAALPAVSLDTTCDLLFGRNIDGPMADATDIIGRFVENPDLSTVTEDELSGTIASLQTAGKNADQRVKPYIDAEIAPLQQLLDAMTSGTNSNVDFADFKAAALELLNQCDDFL